MTIEQWRKEQEDEDFGFRLTNLSPRHTGLPVVVWIEADNDIHCEIPRMLFTNYITDGFHPASSPDSLVPISLHPTNPEILLDNFPLRLRTDEVEKIKHWITLNYPILLAHWNGEISSYEATLKCIPRKTRSEHTK